MEELERRSKRERRTLDVENRKEDAGDSGRFGGREGRKQTRIEQLDSKALPEVRAKIIFRAAILNFSRFFETLNPDAEMASADCTEHTDEE